MSLFFLFTVFALILYTNYPRNGWLLGWDNVVPEFNFRINFQRGFSVWQENQGLGIIGGHGFAATLPHTLIQYILSLVFPLPHLRPVFTLIMVLSGMLGCFFLVFHLLRKVSFESRNLLALISALYYLLNFGTVQMFYIPLEGFTFHYTFLPWLLYSLLKFFANPNRKNLLLFSIISLFSSGQGFIPPLFIIYLMFLLISSLILFLQEASFKSFKKILVICLITLFANSYWAFPVGFYAASRSDIYLKAYNNLQTTEDFVYRSTKFGNLSDVVSLKGFIYEAIDGFVKGEAKYIYAPWIKHLETRSISLTAYFFFLIAVLGVLRTFQSKNKEQIILSLCFLTSFTFLATNVPPFSYLSNILRNELPVFKQAFRISFTKFSISLALFYAVLLAIGLEFLLSVISKKIFKNFSNLLIVGIITLIIFWTWPNFQGNFFYKEIKLDLPKDYLQLFDFFKSKPQHQKIADFPQISPAGWTKYRWGYIGSGFLWYGLPQAILDRNFDVWGNYNENYYWEVSQAIYSKNLNQFRSILNKYDIEWIIIDSTFLGFHAPKAVYLDQLETMLEKIKIARLEATFGNIKIYHNSLYRPTQNNIKLLSGLPRVESPYNWNDYDKIFLDLSDYSQKSKNNPAPAGLNSEYFYYPFRSLFTGREQEEQEFKLTETADAFYLNAQIPTSLVSSYLKIPPFNVEDIIEIDKNDYSKTQKKFPEIYLDGELIAYQYSADKETIIPLSYIKKGELRVKIPKVKGLYSYATPDGISKDIGDYYKCDNFKTGLFDHEIYLAENKNILRLRSTNAAVCFAKYLPTLSQKFSYIFKITSRNIAGKRLSFWLENQQARIAEIDTFLKKSADWNDSYFIQAPLELFGAGFTVHIKNTSIGDSETINEVKNIEIHPFPFRFLSGIFIVNNKVSRNPGAFTESFTPRLTVKHPDLSSYFIKIPGLTKVNKDTTLILSQSFDSQWKAFQIPDERLTTNILTRLLIPLFSTKIDNSFMVNNWENGWDITEITTTGNPANIAIIYMPQYLQYLGFFLLLGIPLVFLLLPK